MRLINKGMRNDVDSIIFLIFDILNVIVHTFTLSHDVFNKSRKNGKYMYSISNGRL